MIRSTCAGSNTNFMVLTRATVSRRRDGIMGTDDDVRPVNTTTPFVDQNQTYTSHASHQVFLRQYVLDAQRRSGRHRQADRRRGATDGTALPGGMATWGEVKEQARMLGIQLTDQDVGAVPLLRTDPYGNFIPTPHGFRADHSGSAPTAFRTRRRHRHLRHLAGARSASCRTAVRINRPSSPTSPTTPCRTAWPMATSKSACSTPATNLTVYDNELLDATSSPATAAPMRTSA